MEREFSEEDLVQLYIARLQGAGVSSAAALNRAVEEGEVGISFDISEIIPPEKQQEIINNNPDSVEIGERKYGVTYAYDPYYKRHTASIIVPVEKIFEIEEVPALPSGRTLVVKVTDSAYERFSGENIEALKASAEDYVLSRQWETFRYSSDAPREQQLRDFDPVTGMVPELPEPVRFGTNPRTHEPAMAYAALTYRRPYWSSDTAYSITYYKTQAEAQKAQEQALAQIETAREEKRKEDERQRWLPTAKAAFSEVENMYYQIEPDYFSLGLTWNELDDLRRGIANLQYEIEGDPKSVLEKIAEIRNRLAAAFEIKERRDGVARRVEELIAEKYSVCPLCGRDLSEGFCQNSEHNVETVRFDVDEYGYITGPVKLSQIKVITETEGEKIVARLMCSAGTGRRYHRGDVYLEKGYDLGYGERWDGQTGDVVFEDFGGIITQEELERLQLGESRGTLSKGVIKIGGYDASANSTMATAFKRATESSAQVTPPSQDTEEDTGELTDKRRRKLEDQLRETEEKLKNRQAELERLLEQERKTALDVSGGETETEIAKPGVRVVANFDKTDPEGRNYAEVVEWPLDRVLHLCAPGLHGPQYVEIIEPIEDGTFYSEELGLNGITLIVKKVDLSENDESVQRLQEKLLKLRRRLG
ncbi:hypothetical protein KBG31_03255 [Patescibacteria group bacterium]|nr:hypothetical protein [Patescibacteria group bacterium]